MIARRTRRVGAVPALLILVTTLLGCGATSTLAQSGTTPSANGASTSSSATATPTLPTPTATPNPGRYDGSWLANTSSSTAPGELVITNAGPTATVQAYSDCGTKCAWGSSSATVGPFSLVVAYTSGSSTTQLTLQLFGSALKVVDVDSHLGTSTIMMHRGSSLELRAFLFAGEWLNNDSHTTGIPELYIIVQGTTMTVHGYGACSPSYCDWGTRTGTYGGDPFKILFDFGGGLTDNLSLTLLNAAGTSLQVVNVGSSSGTNTYTFHNVVPA